MKDECDFASATRGMFFPEHAALATPVRFEPKILEYLTAQAAARGVSLNALINALLRQDIERLKAAK